MGRGPLTACAVLCGAWGGVVDCGLGGEGWAGGGPLTAWAVRCGVGWSTVGWGRGVDRSGPAYCVRGSVWGVGGRRWVGGGGGRVGVRLLRARFCVGGGGRRWAGGGGGLVAVRLLRARLGGD